MAFPDASIEVPSGLAGDDRLRHVRDQIADHLNFNAMAWPARNNHGVLIPPPDEHVLHELAHDYDLASEEDLLTHPRVRTVGFVAELMDCDLCSAPARYDAHVEAGNGVTGGAYLCDDHYLAHGSGTLGAGGDSYIMLRSEIPDHIRSTCNEIRRSQGLAPVFTE